MRKLLNKESNFEDSKDCTNFENSTCIVIEDACVCNKQANNKKQSSKVQEIPKCEVLGAVNKQLQQSIDDHEDYQD